MSADQGRGRRTRIDASHVIAYDERAGAHRYLRDGTVVVEGDRVVHVGRGFEGRADETIDARGRIVAPGFVNVHAHLAGSPLDKSFLEDRGSRQFYLSGLFEYLPVRGAAQDEEATRACFDYSLVELLRTGTTTVLEMGPLLEEAVEAAARVGVRLYLGPGIRDGRWYTPEDRDTARAEWRAKREEWRAWKRRQWSHRHSSGNVAFDEYREETLRKLDEEQREFRDYLDRLRSAKDRAEFDQFMNERRNRPPSTEPPPAPTAGY